MCGMCVVWVRACGVCVNDMWVWVWVCFAQCMYVVCLVCV